MRKFLCSVSRTIFGIVKELQKYTQITEKMEAQYGAG